jgi:hypothetical protein
MRIRKGIRMKRRIKTEQIIRRRKDDDKKEKRRRMKLLGVGGIEGHEE